MDKMTYSQAISRLEEIMSSVQSGKMDIDALSGALKCFKHNSQIFLKENAPPLLISGGALKKLNRYV